MAPVYKIAIIQLYPEPLQLELNYQKAAQYIATATSQGAHLAVLPEYHLSNWLPLAANFLGLCAQWRVYLDKYRALARSHNICIVPGTIVEYHRDEVTDETRLVNVAYFIGNDGEVLGRYEKKNLWHPERPHLTSSAHDPHTVIQTPLGPVGLLICWDLAFPEAFRELIGGGAKIIIIPTFWTLSDCNPAGLALNPLSEALFVTSTLTSRAFENTCAIIFANAGGPPSSSIAPPLPVPTAQPPSCPPPHPLPNPQTSIPTPAPLHYMGLSCATLPFVGTLGAATKDSADEGMSVVELDMEIVEEAERNYGVRRDMAGEEWHYEYRHGRRGGEWAWG